MISNPIQQTKKQLFLQHKRKCWELRQKCWTQERIGKELGISQPAVSRYLDVATKEYKERYIKSVDKVQNEQIAQLERIADEAMIAWEKSKNTKKIITKEYLKLSEEFVNYADEVLKKESNNKITERLEEQCGDPRFLTIAMKAKEDIRKITGADAPIRIINEDSEKNAFYSEVFSKTISVEEAQKYYQEMLNVGNR